MADPRRVKLLVDALRSGQYVQTMSALEITGEDGVRKHCCLGVACRIAMENGVEVETKTTTLSVGDADFEGTHFEGQYGFLPNKVREWFGFTADEVTLKSQDGEGTYDVHVRSDSTSTYLTRASIMNDGGQTFGEIADAFERTYVNGVEGTEVVC